MMVWPDGTVTGSVNVAELEQIQKTMKGASKKQLANLTGPVESHEELVNLLGGGDPEPAAEPDKGKAAETKKGT